MRCLKCQAEIAGEPRYCSECGYNVKSGEHILSLTSGSGFSAQEDLTAGSVGKGALKPPSGFSRTLSTELVGRQSELRTLLSLSTLIENRTYKPGEVMIHKGEMDRDLFFLTEGLVEISRKEGGEDFILNEIEPPHILRDIAFLSGTPRTLPNGDLLPLRRTGIVSSVGGIIPMSTTTHKTWGYPQETRKRQLNNSNALMEEFVYEDSTYHDTRQ